MPRREKLSSRKMWEATPTIPIDTELPSAVGAKLHRLLAEHPLVLVDAGARGGMYTTPSLRPYTRAFGFEPDEEECARLNAHPTLSEGHLEFSFLPFALASTSGRVRVNVCRNAFTSSLLEPDLDVLRSLSSPGDHGDHDVADDFVVVGTFECDAVTLDEFVVDRGLPGVDLVKLDTQGSELDIIEGGRRTFAETCIAATIEVEFKAFYKDQPLFHDVDRRMAELGFLLMDLEPVYVNRKCLDREGVGRGELAWGEAVYVKDLVKEPRFLDADTAKLAKSMLVFESLGFVGYAVYVGRAGTARGKVDGTLIEPLAQAILERNTWSSIRHYRERLEKRCHRAARTAYSHVPSPFKALYRQSPLKDLYARYRRSFWRARGRWE